MEGQHKPLTDSGNAISILFLRYLRFLLFNPKPINQQKETEKGKQKTEIEGGKAGVEQERTEGTEMEGQQMRMPDSGNGRYNSPLSPFPPVQFQTQRRFYRQEVPGPLVGLALAGRGRCRGEKLERQTIDICALSIGGEIEIRRDLVERRQEREVHPSPKMLFGSAQSREAREQA